MSTTLSIELYDFLEQRYGKEVAKEVTKTVEAGLETIEKKAEAVALQKKLELKDELTKELATKADIARLEGEIRTVKVELEGKFEKLNQKFNFMIVLLIIALTLMNPVMADIIKHFLKL